ncbi:hypothetical protein AWM68_02855 [Fictibacillus phosphorivorans]|uniref:Uncharacterized protein n=1 Tax=Fictibacillus phosphorivorans TaxID=1221500 RepID=A0A161TJ32_9BACL|nr:hypothetical protein [Fictibacillus phosphorivorans]KZE69224.1 hypothetical protein AWM68_02855 [Fictibacillus phosphorivorans]
MEILLVVSGFFLFFAVIHYAVRTGIDDSKKVNAIRKELSEIKKQLAILGENKKRSDERE